MIFFIGKKVHTGGGFSGKGFKFDENEAAAVNEMKKYQKVALGLQDSDDEDVEQDIDQHIESMFATKRIVKEIKNPLTALGYGIPTATTTVTTSTTTTNDQQQTTDKMAAKIHVQKDSGTWPSNDPFFKTFAINPLCAVSFFFLYNSIVHTFSMKGC